MSSSSLIHRTIFISHLHLTWSQALPKLYISHLLFQYLFFQSKLYHHPHLFSPSDLINLKTLIQAPPTPIPLCLPTLLPRPPIDILICPLHPFFLSNSIPCPTLFSSHPLSAMSPPHHPSPLLSLHTLIENSKRLPMIKNHLFDVFLPWWANLIV